MHLWVELSISYNQKYNHCEFCAEYLVKDGVPLIMELIDYPDQNQSKVHLIEWYLKLTNDLSFIENRIDRFNEEMKIEVIELLAINKSSFAQEYCFKIAKNTTVSETKFKYINILSKLNQNSAFKLYKEWIFENKRIPDHILVRNFKYSSSNLIDYINLFEHAIIHDYGTSTFNNRNEFINILVELGSKDYNSYQKVKNKFEYWIKNYSNKSLQLYYQLQRLELEYYSKIPQNLALEEVLEIMDKLTTIDRYSFLNGLIELKPNIAGIGINLNLLIDKLWNK